MIQSTDTKQITIRKLFSTFINLLVISALLAISATGRAGNRLTQTVTAVTTNYTYNELDQLLTAGSTQYQYDPRGNLIKAINGAGTVHYGYDAQNRQTSVALPDDTNITNTYDYDGRRVKQVVGTQTTNYLWDETSPYGDVILETGNGNTTSYVLAGSELLSQTRNGFTSYYLQDGQGSTRTLTNNTGDVTDTYSYSAFGELQNQTGSTVNPYLYTGQQYDASTELYSLRARYYSPGIGRFLSQDTWAVNFNNPIELNRYGYTANNPVNASDPSGMFLENALLRKKIITYGSALAVVGESAYLFLVRSQVIIASYVPWLVPWNLQKFLNNVNNLILTGRFTYEVARDIVSAWQSGGGGGGGWADFDFPEPGELAGEGRFNGPPNSRVSPRLSVE